MATDLSSQNNSSSEAPTTSFSLPGADPERCPRCGTEMSADQRYCVECGNRRGKPRFALSKPAAAPPPPTVDSKQTSRTTGGWASGMGLLLTIGVVLLTLGVGYMIGNQGNNGKNASAPIKVYAGGSGAGTTASSSGTSNSNSASSNTGSSGSGKSNSAANSAGTTAKGKPKAPSNSNAGEGANPGAQSLITKKSEAPKSKKKRASNVNKALNSSSVNKNGKTVPSTSAKIGSKCSAGTVGCTNGKLTGPNL
jgi:hypothetical protein